MIRLKTADDIARLAEGGAIIKRILAQVAQQAVAGVPTTELDQLAFNEITKVGGTPAFLNFAEGGHDPFPATVCVSVNDAIVHGIPTKAPLTDGDVVGLDVGLVYQEKYYLDTATTVVVGEASDEVQALLDVTQRSLEIGIAAAQPGARIGDIGAAIQAYVEEHSDFGIVRQLVGHGVGFGVHEDPKVPNYGTAGTGPVIEPGLVIAIEPMLTLGDPELTIGEDGWAMVAKDGSLTAHFEHTVAITEDGPQVLT